MLWFIKVIICAKRWTNWIVSFGERESGVRLIFALRNASMIYYIVIGKKKDWFIYCILFLQCDIISIFSIN